MAHSGDQTRSDERNEQTSGEDADGLPHERSKGWGIATISLISVAALVIVLIGLREFSSIVMPAFLAVTLVLAVMPLHRFLVRHGWPRWLAATVTLVVLYLLLLSLLAMLVWSIWVIADRVPEYQQQLTSLYDTAIQWLGQFGVSQQQITSSLSSISPDSIISGVQGAVGQLGSIGGLLSILVIAVTFFAFDVPAVSRQRDIIARSRPRLAAALSQFSTSVQKYWVVCTVFGLIVAAMDVVALMIIGVPLALVWGVLAFVTNYIPNIGFVLGVIPPTLFALLTGNAMDAVWVLAAYSVINLVMQSFIQPKFYGDAVGLTASVSFLSLVFWATVGGPLGAILAIPLTMAVKTLFIDADPRLDWLATFLSSPEANARRARHRMNTEDPESGEDPSGNG